MCAGTLGLPTTSLLFPKLWEQIVQLILCLNSRLMETVLLWKDAVAPFRGGRLFSGHISREVNPGLGASQLSEVMGAFKMMVTGSVLVVDFR